MPRGKQEAPDPRPVDGLGLLGRAAVLFSRIFAAFIHHIALRQRDQRTRREHTHGGREADAQ